MFWWLDCIISIVFRTRDRRDALFKIYRLRIDHQALNMNPSVALSFSACPVLCYLCSAPSPTLRSLHGNLWCKVGYVAARIWTAPWRPSFHLSFCPEIVHSLTAPLTNFVCPFRFFSFLSFGLASIPGCVRQPSFARVAARRTHPDSPFLSPFFTRSLALQLSATKKNVYKPTLKTLRIEVSFPLFSLRTIFSFPRLIPL